MGLRLNLDYGIASPRNRGIALYGPIILLGVSAICSAIGMALRRSGEDATIFQWAGAGSALVVFVIVCCWLMGQSAERLYRRHLAWLGASAMVLFALSVLFPQLPRDTQAAEVTRSVRANNGCRRNIMAIKNAITGYAAEHGGKFPDSLQELVKEEWLHPACLHCPGASASGTGDAYIYSAAGFVTTDLDPKTIVLVEDGVNRHHGVGMYVATADGSFEFVEGQRAVDILKQVKAGRACTLGPQRP